MALYKFGNKYYKKKTQFPTLAYINVPLMFYQKIHLLCMRQLATNLCAGHKRNCCSKQVIIFSKGYPCTILNLKNFPSTKI